MSSQMLKCVTARPATESRRYSCDLIALGENWRRAVGGKCDQGKRGDNIRVTFRRRLPARCQLVRIKRDGAWKIDYKSFATLLRLSRNVERSVPVNWWSWNPGCTSLNTLRHRKRR